jgi:O-acetyl-ADP-ribose deacetylase (regulator of RNase III)
LIKLRVGELSDAETDAILRPVAADWSAVTPAMRRLELAAGADLEAFCQRLGELPVGSAVLTPAGSLGAQFMVHAVVRSLDEPVTPAGVRRALQNGLRRLVEWKIASVALPPLGTGAGNLDAEESAHIMIPLLRDHGSTAGPPTRFEITLDSAYEHDVFARVLASHGGDGGDAVDIEGVTGSGDS